MKQENDRALFDAITGIDDDLIAETADTPVQNRRKPYWFTAVAALLVLAIGIGAVLGGNGIPGTTGPIQIGSHPTSTHTHPTQSTPITYPTLPKPSGITPPESLQLANLVAAPEYPKMIQKPDDDDYDDRNEFNIAYEEWLACLRQHYDQPNGYADSLTDFFWTSIAEFLQGEGNPTYSPLNVYMGMAMLAETAAGNSRQQILDLFGLETIEQLREQASHVWNANYCDDGETSLLMANSLWLDDYYSFHQNTTDLLSSHYFASSFHGNLGTSEMNQQLQSWLNANSGGLLKDQTQSMKFDPLTVFGLASTMYFTAGWTDKFSDSKTKNAIFHADGKDLLTPFMNGTQEDYYFWSENFGAVRLTLTGNNAMWLILPDEGYTVADILASDDYLRMTMDPWNWENRRKHEIHLSLPKFDIVSQQNLIDGMKNLGITDIFDSNVSDFTALTDTPNLCVGQINHSTRVAIDEEGCMASSIFVYLGYGTGYPTEHEELSFVVDRPFLFVITGRGRLPLFTGIVNEP